MTEFRQQIHGGETRAVDILIGSSGAPALLQYQLRDHQPPGRYCHMGAYSRQFIVTEAAVEPEQILSIYPFQAARMRPQRASRSFNTAIFTMGKNQFIGVAASLAYIIHAVFLFNSRETDEMGTNKQPKQELS